MFGTGPPCLPLLHLAIFLCNDNYRLRSEQDTRILACLRDLCCNPGGFLLDLGFMLVRVGLCHEKSIAASARSDGGRTTPISWYAKNPRRCVGSDIVMCCISATCCNSVPTAAMNRCSAPSGFADCSMKIRCKSRRPVSSMISMLLLCFCYGYWRKDIPRK